MGRGPGSYVKKEYSKIVLEFNNCSYCFGLSGNSQKTIDHIYPLNKGGNSDLINLTCACSLCNSYKSNFTIIEFTSRIKSKRNLSYTKLIGYLNRLYKHRNRNTCIDLQIWLSERIKIERKNHTYYTSIINSLMHKKYLIHGNRI